ncbi:MAG: tyrosine-type recombinase/integrase [Mycobacteriales bacterium]
MYANDLSVVTRFRRHVGNIQLRHLTSDHLVRYFFGDPSTGASDWRGVLAGSGGQVAISTTTARHYRSRLHQFFTFCRGNGWIRIDPLINIPKFPKSPSPRHRVSPLVLSDLLDAAASPRDRAFLSFAMNTGARAGEICSVKVSDLDLAGGSVALAITKTHVYDDDMAISSDLDTEMRRWLVAYAEEAGPLQPDWYLFPTQTAPLFQKWGRDEDGNAVVALGRQRLRPTHRIAHPEKIVQRALAGLGLEWRGRGVHTVRRTVARALYDHARAADLDAIRVVQAFLHHERQSTSEMYIGIDPDKEARNALLRGQPFLSAIVDRNNVTSLDEARGKRDTGAS